MITIRTEEGFRPYSSLSLWLLQLTNFSFPFSERGRLVLIWDTLSVKCLSVSMDLCTFIELETIGQRTTDNT